MHRIYKVQLELTDLQRIRVEPGAEILYAREQGETICLWYRFQEQSGVSSVDESSNTVTIDERWISITGTGHECPSPDKARYLGSAHVAGGRYIWHVFELTDVK